MITRQQEIQMVKALGDAIGYGNMMHLASDLWKESLKEKGYPISGAFIPTLPAFLNEEGKEIAKKMQYID